MAVMREHWLWFAATLTPPIDYQGSSSSKKKRSEGIIRRTLDDKKTRRSTHTKHKKTLKKHKPNPTKT
jgi:hypothetical protein